MNEIPNDVVVLGICIAALDELCDSESASDWTKLARILIFVQDRYRDKLKVKFAEVKNQQEAIEQELAAIQKIREADYLDCIQMGEDGKHYIDQEEFLKRRAKSAKRLSLPPLAPYRDA